MEQKILSLNENYSSKEILLYEEEIKILETTLDQFYIEINNSTKNYTKYEKDIKNEDILISKIEKFVNELYILKETNKFSELLENTVHVLHFILNFHEDMIDVWNNAECLKNLPETIPNVETKLQYFQNQFVDYYDNFINKYKLVIDEKNNMISELSSVSNILPIMDNLETDKLIDVVHEEKLRNITESSVKNALLEIEEQNLNINKFINQINNIHHNITNNNNEILKLDDTINVEIDIKKRMESKKNTAIMLKTHSINLSNQLSETLAEKEEAMEEMTACDQELLRLIHEKESYKQDINIINDDIEANLILQFELKKQNLVEPLNNSIDVKKELETLEKLKITHFEEQKKGNDMLDDMSKKIKQLKNKICNSKCDIRRIDGEISSLNKQIIILEDLKTTVQSNYNKYSFESLQKTNWLTSQKEKLNNEIKRQISNAESCYNIFTDAQNIISKFQATLEIFLAKNSREIKLYLKNITQVHISWNDLDNQMKHLQIAEGKLMPTIFHFENALKDIIANYKKYLKINETLKHNRIIAMLNKVFQNMSTDFIEFQNKKDQILLELEYCITLYNVHNKFCQELENIVPGFISDSTYQEDYDTQINAIVLNRNNFETNEKLLYGEFSKIKEIQNSLNEDEIKQEFNTKKIVWELKLKKICEDLECIEKEKNCLCKIHNTYAEHNNKKIENIKYQYEQILEKCKTEIKCLNATLEETQKKVRNLNQIKQELSQQIETMISEKEVFVKKLRNESLQLKENISGLSDDKMVLTAKLNHVSNDLFKLKSCKTKNITKYKIKFQEIEDTRTNLKYVINLIESLERNMQKELSKTSCKLTGAEDSLTQNKAMLSKEMKLKNKLYLDLQDEVYNLKRRIENVLKLKNKTENGLQILTKKISDFKNKELEETQIYERKLKNICTSNSQMHIQDYNKEIQDLEHKLKENNDIISEQIPQITDLNSKLKQTIEQVKKIKLKKSDLKIKLSHLKTEYDTLKPKYAEIYEIEINSIKRIEQHIFQTHESNQHITKYFKERNDIVSINNESTTELQKEVIVFISMQKKYIKLLKVRLSDVYEMKDTVFEVLSEFYVHNLSSSIENNQHKQILESIEQLKKEESQLECLLQSLYIQKENTDKEYKLVITEQDILTKLCKNLSNYVTNEKKVNESNNHNLEDNIIKENDLTNTNFQEELSSMKEAFLLWQENINQAETDHKQLESDFQMLREKYNTEFKNINEINNKLGKETAKLQQLVDNKNIIISEQKYEIKHLNEQYEKELQKSLIFDTRNVQLQNELDKNNKVLLELQNNNENLQKQADATLQEDSTSFNLDCAVLKKNVEDQNKQLVVSKNKYKNIMPKNLTMNTESSVIGNEEISKNLGNIINFRVEKIRSKYIQKLISTKLEISKSNEIIATLKSQLWSTVYKYVNLKIENEYFRDQLEQYQHTESEEIISSLKFCLWITANRYINIKKKNEKLNEQLQNLIQQPDNLSNQTNFGVKETCYNYIIIGSFYIFLVILILIISESYISN